MRIRIYGRYLSEGTAEDASEGWAMGAPELRFQSASPEGFLELLNCPKALGIFVYKPAVVP